MRRSLVFTPWLLITACSSSATSPAPMPVPTPAPTTAGTGSAQVATPPATGAGSAAGANLPADGGTFAAITAADDGVGGLLGDGASVSTFGGSGSGGGGLTAREGSAAPHAATASLRVGAPTATGDLDVEIIKRYIKRDIPKLRYCYERALGASPTLAGTVTATFMIAGDGTVKSSTAEGVSAKVSTCVAGVIKAIEFPKPTGSSVVVTYPFIFAPSDS